MLLQTERGKDVLASQLLPARPALLRGGRNGPLLRGLTPDKSAEELYLVVVVAFAVGGVLKEPRDILQRPQTTAASNDGLPQLEFSILRRRRRRW